MNKQLLSPPAPTATGVTKIAPHHRCVGDPGALSAGTFGLGKHGRLCLPRCAKSSRDQTSGRETEPKKQNRRRLLGLCSFRRDLQVPGCQHVTRAGTDNDVCIFFFFFFLIFPSVSPRHRRNQGGFPSPPRSTGADAEKKKSHPPR